MFCNTRLAGFAGLVILTLCLNANADLVYDNGPMSKSYASTISGGQSISDSFTVSSSTSLSAAQVGLWTNGYLSAVPVGLDWSIGTSAFGSDISSGTDATLSDTPEGETLDGQFLFFESTFSLSGNLVAGQTYWLTLSNATSNPSAEVGWDDSFGNSVGEYDNNGSKGTLTGPTGSQSFQLYDGPLATVAPLPSTLLGGVGLLGCLAAWVACRRRAIV